MYVLSRIYSVYQVCILGYMEYGTARQQMIHAGERRSCVAIALSLILDVDATECIEVLEPCRHADGGFNGWSYRGTTYFDIFSDLGINLTPIPFKSKTVVTLTRELQSGTYFVLTTKKRHALIIRNGACLDWSDQKRLRISEVYAVS